MSLPALILIHGYTFDHTMWDFVVAELGKHTKVITPDLPGFGDNPVEINEPSIDRMADDVAGLFEFHHLSHAVVAGMSMGGYVALSFAERHKAQIAGLGLISTQAHADTPEARDGRRALIEKIRSNGIQPAIDALLPKLFTEKKGGNPDLAKFATEGAKRAGVGGLSWALQAMATRPDRNSMLRTLHVPAVVIHGAEDRIIPADRARQMSESIPNSNYVEIPGVGHASPLEAPKAVADALLDLLKRSSDFLASHPRPPHEHPPDRPGVIWAPSERGL